MTTGSASPSSNSRRPRIWWLSPFLLASYLATTPASPPLTFETPAPMRARPSPTTTVASSSIVEALAATAGPPKSVLYQPEQHQTFAAPAHLTIAGIGVDKVPVVGVGVAGSGELEIPGATEVGWYRFGVAPGQPGSAVLAAHIAFDGSTGAFRDLARIEVGDEVLVEMSDGRQVGFVVTETAQYGKDLLPLDRIFSKGGEPVLVLISCGGEFNRQLESYSDNVVAYAVPIA